VGLFINTIPVRIHCDAAIKVHELWKRVQESMLDSEPYHYTQLADVKGQSTQGYELIDHIIVFENYPTIAELSGTIKEKTTTDDYFKVTRVDLDDPSSYDLNLIVIPNKNLVFKFKYNQNNYADETILGVKDHLLKLIDGVIESPDEKISKLSLLYDDERDRLVAGFNETDRIFPSEQTVTALFEEVVDHQPDRVALVYEDQVLTYDMLNRKANQVAHYLASEGAGREQIIGLMLDRGVVTIISILGVLKSGAAYLPIDPDYPADRMQFMLEDSACDILLTDSLHMFDAPFFNGRLIVYDIELLNPAKAEENPLPACCADDLMYVMYTSGSTGKPKGVMTTHRNAVRLVRNTNYIDLDVDSKILLAGAFSFDATTFEIWGMLLNGGELHVLAHEKLMDPWELQDCICRNQITIMFFTTSWFNQLVDTSPTIFSGLKCIIFGGEKTSTAHVNCLKKSFPEMTIMNAYGPTENTAFSLYHPISTLYKGDIPIGKPISNTRVYLLDQWLNVCPVGVMGELYVAGVGVGRGYLNQPELTAARFMDDPFRKGERMYRTGDFGRWLESGAIEFAGRQDDQVKIRGYRIELSEIEEVLQRHDQVQAAVVLVREEGASKKLCAYIQFVEEMSSLDGMALREYLSLFLPDYMIPSLFYRVASMPLTVNGKLDRKALLSLDGNALEESTGTYVAPSDELEMELVGIWEDLLNIKPIGVHDNFFELGGHSLKAIQLINQVHHNYKIRLKIEAVFLSPTIKELKSEIQSIRWVMQSQAVD
jgi:amino acid adenylation domain-containing protein